MVRSHTYERHLFVCNDPARVAWSTNAWRELQKSLHWIVDCAESEGRVGVTLFDQTRKGPISSRRSKWGDDSWTQSVEIARDIDVVVIRFSAPDLSYCEKTRAWPTIYLEVSAPINPNWSQVVFFAVQNEVAKDEKFSQTVSEIAAATGAFVHAKRTGPWVEKNLTCSVPQDFVSGGFYHSESTTLKRPDFSRIEGEWEVVSLPNK